MCSVNILLRILILRELSLMFFPVTISIRYRLILLSFSPNFCIFRLTTFSDPTGSQIKITIIIKYTRFQPARTDVINFNLIFITQRIILNNNFIRCEVGQRTAVFLV